MQSIANDLNIPESTSEEHTRTIQNDWVPHTYHWEHVMHATFEMAHKQLKNAQKCQHTSKQAKATRLSW